jgi:hypothetical protein
MKQTTLCLGTGCFVEEDYDNINCAVPFVTADYEDPLSLGPDQPGCEGEDMCENGLPLPCYTPPEVSTSAKVDIEYPEFTPSDYIP